MEARHEAVFNAAFDMPVEVELAQAIGKRDRVCRYVVRGEPDS
jgi:hypothetical protein